MRTCPHCKSIIADDSAFCGNCGKPTPITPERPKTNMLAGVIIGVLTTIVVVAGTAAAILFFSAPQKEHLPVSPPPIMLPAPGPTATPVIVTPAPTATPVPRRDLYNPSLTYKRVNSIHSSTLVDDITYEALRSYIFDFNRCCTTYMNYGSDEIFVFLPEGTSAYKSQTGYKKNHPTLTQEYDYIDVVNARQSGNYYYVWVSETITSKEYGSSKTSTSHWVYELVGSDGSWYINDYIPDPAY